MGRFSVTSLAYPEHIDRSTFAELRKFASKSLKAVCNYEFWSDGSLHEMGTENSNQVIGAPEVIAQELAHAEVALAEDAAGAGHPDKRIDYALRIDFLVALTFELDLWDWTTREVAIFLCKASTEQWRCRFAQHPSVRKYAGRAHALMSHVWANRWGVLIAAAAQGAPYGRFVWICALANRQWPGNKGDIDFKSMVERCDAVIVANPVVKGLISKKKVEASKLQDILRNSKTWPTNNRKLNACLNQLTISRIWCIGE